MEFSGKECWSGLPCPSPGDLPNPGIEPGSPAFLHFRRFTAWATRESVNLPLISLASGKSFNRSVLQFLRLWCRKNNSYLRSVSWCEGLNNLLHINHLEQHLVLNNSIKFAFISYFLPHCSLVVFGWRLARPKQPCHRNSYNTWIMDTKFCVSAGLPGGAAVKNQLANAGDAGSTPGSGRSPGGRYENPLQHSCLENSVDRGAWWASWGRKRVWHSLAAKQQ